MTLQEPYPDDGFDLESFARIACPSPWKKWHTSKVAADRAAAGPKIVGPGAPTTDPVIEMQCARQELVRAVGEIIRGGRYKLCGIPSGAHAPIEIVPDLLAGARVKDMKRSIISSRGRIFDCVKVYEAANRSGRDAEPKITAPPPVPAKLTRSEGVIHIAVTTLWPDGIPPALRADSRNDQIVAFFQEKNGRPISVSAIKRYFRKANAPEPRRPKLALVGP
jgi:hypothetical protein